MTRWQGIHKLKVVDRITSWTCFCSSIEQ